MSIVFGTPTTGKLVLVVQPRGDAERVLAADRDERVEVLAKFASTASTPPSSLYGFVRDVPRIVPPRGSSPEISRGPSGCEAPVDEPAPALAHADHLVAAQLGAAGDRADDRVQAGRVAAAGEDPDPFATRGVCLHALFVENWHGGTVACAFPR